MIYPFFLSQYLLPGFTYFCRKFLSENCWVERYEMYLKKEIHFCFIKIENYVSVNQLFEENIEIDIFVKLSTFELLTFLLITFDIFINSLIWDINWLFQ